MSHPNSGHSKSLSWGANTADTVQTILRAPAKVGLFVGVAGGGVEGLDGVAAVGGGGAGSSPSWNKIYPNPVLEPSVCRNSSFDLSYGERKWSASANF